MMVRTLQVMMSSTTAPFATDVWKVRRRVDDAYMVSRSILPVAITSIKGARCNNILLIVGWSGPASAGRDRPLLTRRELS